MFIRDTIRGNVRVRFDWFTAYERGDTITLPDGKTILPQAFPATVTHDDGLVAELRIELDRWGRGRCSALTVTAPEGEAVTGDRLRALPMAHYVREATLAAPGPAAVERTAKGVAFAPPGEEQIEAVRSWSRVRPSKLDDAHYRAVAEEYRAALGDGSSRKHAPKAAVALHFGVSESTAGRWIAEARRRQYLGPAKPGRVSA